MATATKTLPALYAPDRHSGLREGFTLSDILSLIRQRRRLILLIAAFCVALTAVVVSLLPTFYSASAVVMLAQRRNNVADASSVLTSLPTDPASVQNQIQIITSRDLAAAVVDKLGLQQDPEFSTPGGIDAHEGVVSTFLNRLTVENEGLSTAISIAFKSRAPQKAAQIANAIAETYVRSQLEAKFAATRDATTWLEGRVRDLTRQVQTADAAVERYKAENNLAEAGDGAPLIEQQIGAVSTQLVQARADLAEKQATFSRVDMLMKHGRGADISQAVGSPVIIQLRGQEADLIRSEADLASRYGPKHPKLIAAESQKHDIQQKIGQEVARVAGSIANDLSVSRAQVGSLQASLLQAEHQAQAQDLLRVKLKSLEANAASVHSIYDAFVTRLRTIQDQSAIEASDAQVISHAAVPIAPSSPRRALILGASIPAGLLLGLLAALLAERFSSAISMLRRTRRYELPVLAEISGIAHPRAADLVLDWPSAPYAKAMHRLASDIVSGASQGGPKAILVTSPEAGSGSATVAISLARAAASLGRRVIVLDANLGAPAAAPLVGHEHLTKGLAEVLCGHSALSKAMLKDPRSNVLVLSPVKVQMDAQRVFESRQFRQVIGHLRGACDLLVISAPPALGNNGLQELAGYADAVMLVTRAGAEGSELEMAVRTLEQAPQRPVGMVLAA